jgi:NTP pyrophosphatase (non-canonical NTP hydrolase)
MADQVTTVQTLRDLYGRFVNDRDWEQFHSPKNLVMSLAVETAELMEHFLWIDNEESRTVASEPATRQAVAEEIADVAGHVFCLCNSLGIDLSDAVTAKMQKNVVKYPADQYRGRHTR